MHACTLSCTHARTHARKHARTHTRTHARTHARTHTHARMQARMHVHVHTHACTLHSCKHKCMHTTQEGGTQKQCAGYRRIACRSGKERHLLELVCLGDGRVAAHDICAGCFQVLYQLEGQNGHAGLPPVKWRDVAEEALQERTRVEGEREGSW